MASIEEILKNKGVTTPKVSKRHDSRQPDQIRDVRITRGYSKHPLGSCLIEMGDTRVLCSASMEEKVPPHVKNTGSGWVTAEYGMLPAATSPRSMRESSRGKVGGRTHEIQRLIGRALRASIDTRLLGERTIWIDCDVLQADGGTRTASITGAWVALDEAIKAMIKNGNISRNPMIDQVAAISVGIVDGEPLLDLNYNEDSKAEVDMNVIMTGKGKLIEVQGTAEGQAFSRQELLIMLDLAEKGIKELMDEQLSAIKS